MTETLVSGKFGSLKTITWTNCTTTDVAPDAACNYPINLRGSDYCTIELDSTDSSSTATDIDCNVWASNDGTNFDTVSRWDGYDALNDNKLHSFAVTMGPAFIQLRLDNNTGASRADVTARVWLGRKA